MLFFCPVASHLIFPFSLSPYRIHIPWNMMVISLPFKPDLIVLKSSQPFGFGSFGNAANLTSEMAFDSFPQSDGDSVESPPRPNEKSFPLDKATLHCSEQPDSHRIQGGGFWWMVHCYTTGTKAGLIASFAGPESDVPAFYKIIESIH